MTSAPRTAGVFGAATGLLRRIVRRCRRLVLGAHPERIDMAHWKKNILTTDRHRFDIESYVRAADPEDFDLLEKMRQWRERGIVTFQGCVDEADIEALLADVAYLVENRSGFKFEIEYRGRRLNIADLEGSPFSDTGVKFNCIENISLAARRLSLSRVVCRFLRHVFQDDPVVIQSLTFWRGSEQPAHLDYPYVNVQTKLPHLAASWIPLEDVHADAGPLAYYPGSHREGVIAPFDWGEGSLVFDSRSRKSPEDFAAYVREWIEKKNLKKEIFLPRKGDALIWHGNVLHEGTKVNDPARTRRSYVTHYTSLAAYPRGHMMPGALQGGHFTTLNQGIVFDHPWAADARRLPSWQTRA